MTVLQAIAFGLVQGLGEFLPISSSAHLTILPWAAGWPDPGLATDVALHLGTLIALLVYFRADLLRLARAFAASLIAPAAAVSDPPASRPGFFRTGPGRPVFRFFQRRFTDENLDARLAWLVIVGSLPGALIGYLLEHRAEESFRAPWLIAITMIVMGLVLFVTDRLGRENRSVGSLRVRDAITIGLAQAFAIIPGVSRSGATISTARALGLDREAAARFSFYLAIPIVAGAALLKVPKLIKEGGLTPTLTLAIVVAGLSGYLAIDVLLRFVRTNSYLPFVVYRVLFGVGVLALFFFR